MKIPSQTFFFLFCVLRSHPMTVFNVQQEMSIRGESHSVLAVWLRANDREFRDKSWLRCCVFACNDRGGDVILCKTMFFLEMIVT